MCCCCSRNLRPMKSLGESLASPVGYRYPYTLDVSVVVVALGPLFHIFFFFPSFFAAGSPIKPRLAINTLFNPRWSCTSDFSLPPAPHPSDRFFFYVALLSG